jgi:pSer/pThr/pTyr-binding forkhead associated (FHA) protein
MAKLILSLDGQVLNEFLLAKERTGIGRKPHNDIQIDNLAVSGEHAVVVMIGNDCFLEDVGSTNGTLVNGVPVKKHLLRNNDVIELGKYKLTFVGRSPVPSAADYDKTMLWRPADAKQAAAQSAAATSARPAPGDPAWTGAPTGAAATAAPTGAAAGTAPTGAAAGTAPTGAAARTAPTGAAAKAAPGRGSAEEDAARAPIWKIGLVLLAILVLGYLLFGMPG